MEVILDGEVLAGGLAGKNLKEMLEDLYGRVMGPERALRELIINGRPYEERGMGLPQEIERQQIQKLELTTVSSWEVAQHFLGSAEGILQNMVEAAEGAAELFRVGDKQEANEQYLRVLENLGLFLNMLQRSQEVLGLDFQAAQAGEASAAERLERLKGLTGEMLSAQEQEDWLLLADITGHDLTQELQAWQKLMKAFVRQGTGEA